MKNLFTILFILILSSVFGQSDAKSLEIINKSIDAIGGKEKLLKMKTLYSEMKMGDEPVLYITREMAPNKGALEIQVNGNIVYSYRFDGTKGFENKSGNKSPMNDEENLDKKNRKYITNELAYADSSIWTFEFVNDNNDTYKLKGKNKNGTIEYIYFDKKTYYKVKSETVIQNDDNQLSTLYYKDYRNFDGYILYYNMTHIDPSKTKTEMKIDKYIINKGISNKDFVY